MMEWKKIFVFIMISMPKVLQIKKKDFARFLPMLAEIPIYDKAALL